VRAADSEPLQLNRWTHFVGTFDGSELKLYRDGVLVGTKPTSAAIPEGNEQILIGRRWDFNNTVRGRLDEVAMYRAALPASRVQAHFDCATNSCDYDAAVRDDNPAGYWRLGDASGGSAANEIADTGSGTYVGAKSLGGEGATHDGNGSVALNGGYVDLVNSPELRSSHWTVEGWIYPTQQPDNGATIITEAYNGDGNVRFALGTGDDAGNRVWVGFYNGGWLRAVDQLDLELNRWTYFAGTFDGTALTLYRDGSQVSTTAVTSPSPNGTENIYIGRRWDLMQTIKGSVDEVAIYPEALTNERILDHFLSAR
ncbi:MAG: LamG domain-containing protein, partial [Acidobacteria bacterium]|nr:LamG domain-containing protein [Acidobacteriota bacterium]